MSADAKNLIKHYLDQIGKAIIASSKTTRGWNVYDGLEKVLVKANIQRESYDGSVANTNTNYIDYFQGWEENVLPSYFEKSDWKIFMVKTAQMNILSIILEDILYKICGDIFEGVEEIRDYKEQDYQAGREINININEKNVYDGVYYSHASHGIIGNLIFATSTEEERQSAQLSRDLR